MKTVYPLPGQPIGGEGNGLHGFYPVSNDLTQGYSTFRKGILHGKCLYSSDLSRMTVIGGVNAIKGVFWHNKLYGQSTLTWEFYVNLSEQID